jgi:hypothetical protein
MPSDLEILHLAIMKILLSGFVSLGMLIIYPLSVSAQQTRCPFDTADSQTLGKCLLRPVKMRGHLGAPLPDLPSPLDSLIGQPLKIGREAVEQFLRAHNIRETDVGGSLSVTLPERVRFFVIHDTSSPYLGNSDFPSDIDEASWKWNNLKLQKAVAHVFVNRAGESETKVNFEIRFGATKFERANIRHKGKFVHVEMIQPRRRDPLGPPKNDAIAPEPGFTQMQLDRLALLYVVASVRRGQWLIPGFHCSIDAGIPNAHDDPQNFDLGAWLESLQTLLAELGNNL